MRFTIVNFVYLFYTIVKGFDLSKLLSVTSTIIITSLVNLLTSPHFPESTIFLPFFSPPFLLPYFITFSLLLFLYPNA